MGENGALDAHRRKRDLSRSDEPAGGARRPGHRPTFVVQKHSARSLHYDFRLEADHPLDYENFEGVIPRGDYGAGSVIVWDTGTYENRTKDSSGTAVPVAEAIERGHVTFDLHGKKLRGGWSLTRIAAWADERDPGWLLVKKADKFAEPGSDPERDEPESVKSGKDIEQVADEK